MMYDYLTALYQVRRLQQSVLWPMGVFDSTVRCERAIVRKKDKSHLVQSDVSCLL
jgi:hypothetical protein